VAGCCWCHPHLGPLHQPSQALLSTNASCSPSLFAVRRFSLVCPNTGGTRRTDTELVKSPPPLSGHLAQSHQPKRLPERVFPLASEHTHARRWLFLLGERIEAKVVVDLWALCSKMDMVEDETDGNYPQHNNASSTHTTTDNDLTNTSAEDADFSFRPGRRGSTATTTSTTSVGSMIGHGHMTETEQEERRRQIKNIMRDSSLSQKEKSRHIQALMDGRVISRRNSADHHSQQAPLSSSFTSYRRNSASSNASSTGTSNASSADYACSMASAAALAADYYSDDHTLTDHEYDYNEYNETRTSNNEAASTAAMPHFGNLKLNHGAVAAATPPPLPLTAASHHHLSPRSHNYNVSDRVADEQSIASTVASYDNAAPNHDHNHQSSTTWNSIPAGRPYKEYHGRSHSLQDWKDTDRLTAAAKATVCNPVQISRLMEQSRPVCEHYDRKCTIISPCCGLAFGCRICHDECPVLPPPLHIQRRLSATHASSHNNNHTMANGSVMAPKAAAAAAALPVAAAAHKNKVERRRSMPLDLGSGEEEDDHHLIDRFKIREVICRDCYTRQTSKT
jgi:hypothetical protein